MNKDNTAKKSNRKFEAQLGVPKWCK